MEDEGVSRYFYVKVVIADVFDSKIANVKLGLQALKKVKQHRQAREPSSLLNKLKRFHADIETLGKLLLREAQTLSSLLEAVQKGFQSRSDLFTMFDGDSV